MLQLAQREPTTPMQRLAYERVLGKGGFGVVRLVRDVVTGELAALKRQMQWLESLVLLLYHLVLICAMFRRP